MIRVPAHRLAAIMRSVLSARDVSAEHAELVVTGLLTASLRGVDTHGVRLFPVYVAELSPTGSRSLSRSSRSSAPSDSTLPELRPQAWASARIRVAIALRSTAVSAGCNAWMLRIARTSVPLFSA